MSGRASLSRARLECSLSAPFANRVFINNDFGDNKFPYFKGNTNKRLEEFSEDKDSDDEDIEYVTNISVEKLYKYIPSNVLRFLSTPLNKL